MGQFNYSQYLSRLNEFERVNAPVELFLQGDESLLQKGVRVSVVGSRKPSENGVLRAQILTKALLGHGIIVVSGLAEGIDTVAHQTAIKENGRTIAVLGTPFSKVYPASNKALFEKIVNEHLAITQFPENYSVQKQNFPMRNRTMALISDATIIVEASENSGTRHQGWEALRLGRLVFILQSIVENPQLTWPKEMLNYGAQILRREDMDTVFENIPSLTSSFDLAF
ncbi:MAG: DNA-processing protein DprA [Bacteroidales bacterium]|nr:DNA-processing protein DprA [Bacteroidales bacterium]